MENNLKRQTLYHSGFEPIFTHAVNSNQVKQRLEKRKSTLWKIIWWIEKSLNHDSNFNHAWAINNEQKVNEHDCILIEISNELKICWTGFKWSIISIIVLHDSKTIWFRDIQE
jgi:hypothetical protein